MHVRAHGGKGMPKKSRPLPNCIANSVDGYSKSSRDKCSELLKVHIMHCMLQEADNAQYLNNH